MGLILILGVRVLAPKLDAKPYLKGCSFQLFCQNRVNLLNVGSLFKVMLICLFIPNTCTFAMYDLVHDECDIH